LRLIIVACVSLKLDCFFSQAFMTPEGSSRAGVAACIVGVAWTGSSWLSCPSSFLQPSLHRSLRQQSQAELATMQKSVATSVLPEPPNTSTGMISLLIGSCCVASAITARCNAAQQVCMVACKALPTPAASVGGKEEEKAAVVAEAATATDEPPAPPPPPPPPPPFDPAKAIGVTAPLGYFDPLGFCKVGDYAGFHKLRSAELKHGRVAMMAAAGTVFAHYVKFPGFEKVPAGLGALGDPAAVIGFFTIFPLAGFIEIVYWKDDLSKEPGNFGDPADWAGKGIRGLGSYSDDMRNKELNNGRMAMFSILGIILAELVTGKDGIQQFGLP